MTLARAIPALILAALASAPAAAAPATTTVESESEGGFAIGPSARFLFAPLQGDCYADRDLSFGTSMDLRSDLGLSGTSPLVELGVVAGWWDAWRPGQQFTYGFEVRGMWGDWTGRSRLGAPVAFDGDSFPAGDSVKSTFSVDLTRIHATGSWRLGTDDRNLRLGLFIGTTILGASLEMDGASGAHERAGLRMAPIGGGIRVSASPCPWFDAGLEAAYYGASIHIEDRDWDVYKEVSELVDLSARVSFRPWKYAAVEVGYRFLDAYLFQRHEDEDYWLTGDRHETELSWRMQGWFVGGTIRF